jgi:hypothetical protein
MKRVLWAVFGILLPFAAAHGKPASPAIQFIEQAGDRAERAQGLHPALAERELRGIFYGAGAAVAAPVVYVPAGPTGGAEVTRPQMPSRALVHPLAGPRLGAAPKAAASERTDDTSLRTGDPRSPESEAGKVFGFALAVLGLNLFFIGAGTGYAPLAVFGLTAMAVGLLAFVSSASVS